MIVLAKLFPKKESNDVLFTADEHYGHKNIITYCDRPFKTVYEMDGEIAKRHNEVVSENDIVVHAGDFALCSAKHAENYIRQLNGMHIFLQGSHDRWAKNRNLRYILELTIEKQLIVVCHYAMRTWHKSHYNSFNLYGHSHGKLRPEGKSWDIGVDNNGFYPVSWEQIKEIMRNRPDNFNYLGKRNKV